MKASCLATLGLLIALYCGAPIAVAYGGERLRLTQYRHRSWAMQEGWFESRPMDIVQGRDGYIWIATEMGVLRFDGVRFTPWVPPQGHVALTHVKVLLQAHDGAMWMVANQGLSVWRGGRLTDVPLDGGSIQSLYEDRDGTVWAARARLENLHGPVCSVSTVPVRCYGAADGLNIRYATIMTQDQSGYFWIGSGALSRWKPGAVQSDYFVEELKAFGNSEGILAMLSQTDGSLLVGLGATGKSAGLQRLRDDKWQTVRTPGFDGGASGAGALLEARDHSIWVAPLNTDLIHVHDDEADAFTPADGLTGTSVDKIIQDSEGTIWATTETGIHSFSKFPVTHYSQREGMPTGTVYSVAEHHDGGIAAAADQVAFVDSGHISAFVSSKSDSADGFVNAMTEDSSGYLWVAKGNRLFLYQGGTRAVVKAPNGSEGLQIGEILSSLAEDSNHSLWGLVFGNHRHRLVAVKPGGMSEALELPAADGARWLAADREGGIWTAGTSNRIGYVKDGKLAVQTIPNTNEKLRVIDLFADVDGTLLVSSNQGLYILRAGKWRRLGGEDGLPCQFVFTALTDLHGALWFSSACGLVRIENRDWTDVSRPVGVKVPARVFTPSDGWTIGYEDTAGKAARAHDGTLWFAGRRLQTVDPDSTQEVTTLPPVQIERVVVNRLSHDFDSLDKIAANPREIEIDYTVASFLNPSAIHFKYRLEGYENAWQELGSRRQAFYNDLPPGDYLFHVMARYMDGVWNEPGTAIHFKIMPMFYQTLWFRGLAMAMVGIIVWAVFVFRLRRVTRLIHLRHQERLLVRESIARDLHDTFFQAVQSLFLRLHTASRQLPPHAAIRLTLERVLDDSDRVMSEGRDLMLDLRAESSKPTELVDLFSSIGEELKMAYPAAFAIAVMGTAVPLYPVVFEELQKFGREALSNAFRHSHAKLIEVELNYTKGGLGIRIRDDGVGIEEGVLKQGFRAGHLGLPGMRERAKKMGAEVDIWSRPQAGTEIELRVSAARAFNLTRKRVRAGWITKIRF
jgi:signal transduction histidine kinase/ligand-binding sensor domain-containing protein